MNFLCREGVRLTYNTYPRRTIGYFLPYDVYDTIGKVSIIFIPEVVILGDVSFVLTNRNDVGTSIDRVHLLREPHLTFECVVPLVLEDLSDFPT